MSKGDKEMNTNKERILRDIEYISGGITVFKSLCDKENKSQARYYKILDEWQDILCFITDMIEEDYTDAQNT
jgi:hypothetical protein